MLDYFLEFYFSGLVSKDLMMNDIVIVPAEKIKAGSLGEEVEGRHPIKNTTSLYPISRPKPVFTTATV